MVRGNHVVPVEHISLLNIIHSEAFSEIKFGLLFRFVNLFFLAADAKIADIPRAEIRTGVFHDAVFAFVEDDAAGKRREYGKDRSCDDLRPVCQ